MQIDDLLTLDIDVAGTAAQFGLLAEDVLDVLDNGDLTDALREVARGPLDAQVQREFDLGIGPDGQPWPEWHFRAPWAPKEHPRQISSGNLMESYLNPDHEHHIERIGPREMEWGSAAPYAQIQHDGATFKLGIPLLARDGKGGIAKGTEITIPPHPVVHWADETVAEAERIIGERLAELLRQKAATKGAP